MVRVAIAGAAHPHVEYATQELASSPDLQLVGVSDESIEIAKRWAEPFGVRAFDDHRALLEETEPDIVVVAGIYGDRGRVIVDALNAGCDVVADKPMCTTVHEVDAIAEASRRNDKVVTLLLEKRYYPETLAARELLQRGDLGALVGISSSGPHKLNRQTRPDWFFQPERYGGILNDLTVHDIDLALALTKAKSGTIIGAVAGSIRDAPGFSLYGVTTITTPDSVISLEANWLTPSASAVHGDYQMRLVGTEGVAELFWARQRLVVTTEKQGTHDVDLPRGFRSAELALGALARGEAPEITTHDSLLATRLALLAQRCADSGENAVSWAAGTD